MSTKPVEECTHDSLMFGSGDYYIFCHECGSSWMRRDPNRQEYGMGENGKQIGAAPELSGKGPPLSGRTRTRNSDY